MVINGGGLVKIKKFAIKNLYGVYNYNIDFDNKVTFLYGSNGCGKTTILNIICHIIKGEIYKLFDYNFEKILLKYNYNNKMRELTIETVRNNDLRLIVNFENEREEIIKSNSFFSLGHPRFKRVEGVEEELGRIREEYFRDYPIMNKISEKFPLIYLSLVRLENEFYKRYKNRWLWSFDYIKNENLYSNIDEALDLVKNMILYKNNEIEAKKSEIDKVFQETLLKKTITSGNVQVDSLLKEISNLKIGKMEEVLLKYKEVLEVLDIDTKVLEKINDDNEKILKIFKGYKEGVEEENILFLVVNFYKIKQAEQIVNEYQNSVNKKIEISYTVENFIKAINGFLNTGDYAKEIFIQDKNDILYRNKFFQDGISIDTLSSGEKQIFILLSYLIFEVAEMQEGIYIIDEPESSLHIEWQERFVESLINIHPNLQLILATHSPEIISKFTDNAIQIKERSYAWK